MRFIDPFEAEIKRQQEELDHEENEDPPSVNPSNDINDHEENDNDEENVNLLSDQNDNTVSLNNDNVERLAKMNAIMSKFTEDQMSRFEFYRRSRFKKNDMRRLLIGVTGIIKIPEKLIIVVSATAKMFVGDVVETARKVMVERKESGKIRTCHIREAYRRLKINGKVPKRLVPRRF